MSFLRCDCGQFACPFVLIGVLLFVISAATPLSDLDAVIPMLEGIQQTLMQSKCKSWLSWLGRLVWP